MNIMQNLKNSVKTPNLIDYAMGPAVAVWARYAPTMMGLGGWIGYLVAYILPALIGMLFNKPSITVSALSIGSSHLLYQFTTDANKPDDVWDLDPNGDGTIEFMAGLPSGMSGYGYDVKELQEGPVLNLSGYSDDASSFTTLEDRLLADNLTDRRI